MPELPEVENVGLAIRAALLGKRLDGIRARFAGSLKPSPAAARQALLGARLSGVRRHGKYLFLDFDRERGSAHILRETAPDCGPLASVDHPPLKPAETGAPTGARDAMLMLHLRMTGQVFVDPDYRPDKHVRLVFDFEGQQVYYRDMRKFGGFVLLGVGEESRVLGHLGPDMLRIPFGDWLASIGGRRAPLKSLLLDQRIAAGVGNIYADEALFRAGVHPSSPTLALDAQTLKRVWLESRRVLRMGIRHGGTTFINFVDFRGKPGNFRRKLRVFDRQGEACSRCGSEIQKTKVGGRGTHYCPSCQKPARVRKSRQAAS